jgi:hypothetical protein
MRNVAATLFPHILLSCHRKVNYAEQEALILFSGRHSLNTTVSAEFLCIWQMLQGFAGKSKVSKNTYRPICSVASVFAVLVLATSAMMLDFIRPKKRPYINCKA